MEELQGVYLYIGDNKNKKVLRKEAKEILQSKFGGEQRKLQAYMDQIKKMPPLKSNDVQSLEQFADLVRIAVVKLQAEGHGRELGEGALHSLLVKNFADSQVESYSRWLREHKKDRSVLSLRDWLKEEVRIRVEAVEMAHAIEAETVGVAMDSGKQVDKGVRIKNLSSEGKNFGKEPVVPTSKPPCVFCGGNQGVWSCRRFQIVGVKERWNVTKDKRLCFRCLASDREGRACTKAQPCNINGCKRNHHHLLHGFAQGNTKDGRVVSPWEGHQLIHTHQPPSRRQQRWLFLFVPCQCG